MSDGGRGDSDAAQDREDGEADARLERRPEAREDSVMQKSSRGRLPFVAAGELRLRSAVTVIVFGPWR
jgi:hypothetical protein